ISGLFHQPCLADPGLAAHQDHGPPPAPSSVRYCYQGFDLEGAPDEYVQAHCTAACLHQLTPTVLRGTGRSSIVHSKVARQGIGRSCPSAAGEGPSSPALARLPLAQGTIVIAVMNLRLRLPAPASLNPAQAERMPGRIRVDLE